MKKLFNFRPIVFAAIFLAAGIFCSVLMTTIKIWAVVIPLVLITVEFVILSFVYKKPSFMAYGAAFVLIFFIGFFLTFYTVNFSAENSGEKYTTNFTATVKEVGSPDDDGQRQLILTDVSGDKVDFRGTNIAVYTGRSDYRRGDKISGSATFVKRALDFKNTHYLVNKIVFAAYNDTVEITKTAESTDVAVFVADEIQSAVTKFVEKEQAGVIVALLLGRTDGISENLLYRYRFAGVAHIFAVSGLHVGFFFSVFGFLFGLIGIKRWRNVLLATMLSIFYAIICASVSAYRAVIMCFIYGMAKSFGKKYDFLNSIFLSMSVVLPIFPTDLFDVGFLLSYSAVISLALFSAQFAKKFSFLPDKLATAFAASLSVVLGTLPVVIRFFGYASVITVYINLLFVPIVPLVYVLSFFGAVLAAIFSHGNVFLSLAALICKAINTIMTQVDFERFILQFHGDEILLVAYSVILVLTSEKINIPAKFKRVLLYLLPVSALTLI